MRVWVLFWTGLGVGRCSLVPWVGVGVLGIGGGEDTVCRFMEGYSYQFAGVVGSFLWGVGVVVC